MAAVKTGDKFRLDLSIDEIREYMADYPNDDDLARHKWVGVIASLNHEATAASKTANFAQNRSARPSARLSWSGPPRTPPTTRLNIANRLRQISNRSNPVPTRTSRPSARSPKWSASSGRSVTSTRQIENFEEADDLSDEDTDLSGFGDILAGMLAKRPLSPKRPRNVSHGTTRSPRNTSGC